MKLFLLCKVSAACDIGCSVLHKIERGIQWVRMQSWTAATKENLRQCNARAVKRYSVYD